MVDLYVYITSHVHSRAICPAFAEGASAPIVNSFRLQPEGAVAVYGRLRGCNEILYDAMSEGRDWYYIDRGYMRASHDDDYSGYFRVTKNALQSDGTGNPDYARWAALGMQIKPWRKGGSHILICPPGKVYGQLTGFDSDEWTSDVLSKLSMYTDRQLRIREKPRTGQRNVPLAMDLEECWAMVVHSSNAATGAAMMGVPTFATARCAASAVSKSELSQIETPLMVDNREEWLATLANQQWTLDEMRAGLCWAALSVK